MLRTAILLLALLPVSAAAQPSRAPARYDGVVDRAPRQEPALPPPGIAGSGFTDPAFGSRLWRVTDATTRPGARNRSYRTPSGTHQNAWSASGRYFYVVSTDGTVVPFAFDAASARATRVERTAADDGGLVLRFYNEPHFSYVQPDVIYGSTSGGSLRTIDQFDFSTGTYTRLLDLDALVPGLGGTYVGGLGASAGAVERIVTFFGGSSQDRHPYLVVFDRANPARRRLLNTRTSTLDGRPTRGRLDFLLHAAAIDRSGRYVTLYPAGADRGAPRHAEPNYVWDTETDTFTALPSMAARSNGHDAFGYGVRVNQDCCTAGPWDAAQWQFRSLADPLATRDVIAGVLAPKQVYLADHPSWHNARPDTLVPFISALYRYGADPVEWRAWDDEIVAVDPNAGDARVWRVAHHRSDVRHDQDGGRIAFWYTPRPNVSPDGRWVLFTSNWEKTLGSDPAGDPGTAARQDVFLVRLEAREEGEGRNPGGAGPPGGAIDLPDGRVGRLYSARLALEGVPASAAWQLVAGSLPPGIRLARSGRLGGAARTAGTFRFTVLAEWEGAQVVVSVTWVVR
jgi:hypothetical protein